MMRIAAIAGLFLLTLVPSLGLCGGRKQAKSFKAPKLENILPLLDASSPQALSGVLRGVIVKYMPNPLYEKSPGWGNQCTVRRLRWNRDGLRIRPEFRRVRRNDGTWRRIRFDAVNLPNTLILDIRNVRFPEPSRMKFEVFLAFDGRVRITQQNWQRGIRLWSGSVRARMRVKLHLFCEATTRLEPKQKSLLPDAVFRMRATKAVVSYDNLVYEHVPGIGGGAAQILGKSFHSAVSRIKPSLERNLLAKGNAAIVRAADTKEVRISFSRAFNSFLHSK